MFEIGELPLISTSCVNSAFSLSGERMRKWKRAWSKQGDSSNPVGQHEGRNHRTSYPGSKELPKQLDFTRWEDLEPR